MEEGREVGEMGAQEGKEGREGVEERRRRGFNESSFKHRGSRHSIRQSSKPNVQHSTNTNYQATFDHQ
jgi:hypothetical protein